MVNIKRIYSNFKYPKLFLLVVCIIASYFLFRNEWFQYFIVHLGNYSYLGVFIAGMLFAFGFTAPFSVAFFLSVDSNIHIIDAALLGGFGALIADLAILSVIRFSFMDEFKRIKSNHVFKSFNKLFRESFLFRVKTYLVVLIAGIVIASPLPDEIGVALLAGFTKIDSKVFALVSFLLNSIGILVILLLGGA